MENLSSWLTLTNANIHDVLQSVNKQRTLLIIKVWLERVIILDQTEKMSDIKEQGKIQFEGLHLSDCLNDNEINYIENWLELARELLNHFHSHTISDNKLLLSLLKVSEIKFLKKWTHNFDIF